MSNSPLILHFILAARQGEIHRRRHTLPWARTGPWEVVMTFDTPMEGRGCVLLTPHPPEAAQMHTITPFIRPEHYVFPVKHPANCRCTQHGAQRPSQSALDSDPNCLLSATLTHVGQENSKR